MSFSKRSDSVELLRNNLDYLNMRLESSRKNEKILIIPLKEDFKSKKHLKRKVIANVILHINSYDNIKEASIVYFTPAKDLRNSIIPQNTFYNIFNAGANIEDGDFIFSKLTGELKYEISHKFRRLNYAQHKETGSSNQMNSRQMSSLKSYSIFDCVDVYLVTYYYDASTGNLLYTEREFLYRQGNCGTSGEIQNPESDGAAGGEIEEYAVAKTSVVNWHAFNVPQEYGGGRVAVTGVIGWKEKIRNSERWFTGGHARSHDLIANTHGGIWSTHSWGVVIESPVTAKATCYGNLIFPDSTGYFNVGKDYRLNVHDMY